MAIVLNAEQERQVNETLRCGGYSNAEEVLDRALEMLRAQEAWLERIAKKSRPPSTRG